MKEWNYSHSQFKKIFDLLLMDKLWTEENSEDIQTLN